MPSRLFKSIFFLLSPNAIKEWLVPFGIFTPIIFICAYIVRPLLLFPASVLSITSGLVFGAVTGTIYTVIGATLGALLSFFLAKKLGEGLMKKKNVSKFELIQQKIEQNGIIYVLFLRLIPIFNFDLISYLAGLTRMKIYSFFLATFIGIIPGTFAYNFLGSSLGSGNWKQIILAVIVFCMIIGFTIVLKRKMGSKEKGVTKH